MTKYEKLNEPRFLIVAKKIRALDADSGDLANVEDLFHERTREENQSIIRTSFKPIEKQSSKRVQVELIWLTDLRNFSNEHSFSIQLLVALDKAALMNHNRK